ncbi:MAG: type II secretion system protein [Candidatus Ryanbacteria bacterium]|nr:type II secretion system protein [Candidatus Ryanbacteria bacterium]
MKKRGGFTLIELLIVIGLIAILAGVVFVALDPFTRFRDARNARRNADVASIASAIRVNQVDLGGLYTPTVEDLTANDTNAYLIGTEVGSGCAASAPLCVPGGVLVLQVTCLDLSALATSGYLGTVPKSPPSSITLTWADTRTGYYLVRKLNGAITVGACDAEGAAAIQVTR